MVFNKIKVRLIIFALVSISLLNDTSVFANSLDSRKYFKDFVIRNGTEEFRGHILATKMEEDTKANENLKYYKSDYDIGYYNVGGHAIVKKIRNNGVSLDKSKYIMYDSNNANNANGVLPQHYNDCFFHAVDNFFYLEKIGEQVGSDGHLYYTDFSRKLRDTAGGNGMYIFYAFIYWAYHGMKYNNLEDKTPDKYNRYDFLDKEKKASNGKKLKATLEDIINEFKVVKKLPETDKIDSKEIIMEFVKYFFTYIKKDEMKLADDFDFIKDTPHLLWLFKESLGLSTQEIDVIINNYKHNYKLPPLPVIPVPPVPTTPTIPVVPSYVPPSISPYIINERSVKFLSDFSDVYLYVIRNVIISEINHIGGVGNNGRKSGGFDISTGYETNKKQADGSDIKESLSVNMDYRTRMLNKSSNFGIMFGFNYNLLSLENLRENFYDGEDPMKLYHITFGAGYRKIYNYDNVSNFNLGFMLNWKIDNKRKYLKDNFGFSFRNRNITVFLQDNRVFDVDKLIISSIIFSSSISYTNVNIDKIETESGFDNYDINDATYHMVLLGVGLSLRKDISIGFLKNSSAVGIDFVSNLNNQRNDFSLNNKYGGEKEAIINDVEKIKNGFAIRFRNDLEIAKHITVGVEIGENLNIKKSMFFRGNLNISF